MKTPRNRFAKAQAKFTAVFGQSLIMSSSLALIIVVTIGIAVFMFFQSGAPTTVTITSGPEDSTFRKNAEKYKAILAKQGVKLKILPSAGADENLQRLVDPKAHVDVGFVLGGKHEGINTDNLVSLGSISYQPLMIFYRGAEKKLLSEFKGKRLDIGPVGSGSHTLALVLLKANGIEPGGDTQFVDLPDSDSIRGLTDGRIDALFIMGDSSATTLIRELLRDPDLRMFNFTQADGYVRRIAYLNKLELPKGSLDFGKDIPPEDVHLVAPTVELIARQNLHPAISDLLLEAAKEVHGTPGIFRKRGEFPAPLEHEFRISPDATRYYTSGKSFLYRTFPFWLASLVNRILVVIVPAILLLVPALKIIPTIYRWRMQSRIYRWYGALLNLEHQANQSALTAKEREDLLRRLRHIENTVSNIKMPAAYADLLYGLRGHIGFVRNRLLEEEVVAADGTSTENTREGKMGAAVQ
ncbi:MAG TPA: TAXI family TRAP transporter solute-binding subunit [Burkholderiaceae bacterium]